jgi:Rps23 Pro-64 3,4-dihydroxylase Tpa1-like proline 4-hydroxylase
MPLPLDQPWEPEWGGALELYPVTTLADGSLEPKSKPVNLIPPSWNQFIFFEIQPGRVSALEVEQIHVI